MGCAGSQAFGLVILNEHWELQVPLGELQDHGFDWVHLPCPDYFSPTTDEIDMGMGNNLLN